MSYAGACLWSAQQQPDFALPFGPRPWVFVGLMIAIAVLCSRGRAVLEYRQPETAHGDLRPLIVFETLAGLL